MGGWVCNEKWALPSVLWHCQCSRAGPSKARLLSESMPGRGGHRCEHMSRFVGKGSAAASDLAWVGVITTGRSRLACAWATQRGGRDFHSEDQSSVKRSSDPRLHRFSGKRLGRGFWAAQLSRISWDTILASEKGTAREQSFNVRLGLYEHKTSQQLGRGPESAPCHHGNVRSQLQIKMKTLWALEFCPFNVALLNCHPIFSISLYDKLSLEN